MAEFTDDNLRHLLRRTEFVVRPERLAALQATGSLISAVNDVLAIDENPIRAGRGPVPYFDSADDSDRGWVQYARAANWWVDYAARGGSSPDGPATPPAGEWRALQEKMVLFWHGHFVTSWSQIHKGVHLMWQLHGYRQRTLGNLVDLAQQMAVSPAMLVYLSNGLSVKGEPNQNFARELMELFTMGVGNYTEADVDAVSRAWTGHNYSYETQRYVFVPEAHDDGLKTLFGVAANWNGPDVINAILADNPAKTAVAARFITRKLWEFMAYVGPDATLVNTLADVLLSHGMQVAPLLRAMLLRDEFYATQARQGLVRSPLEWIFALAYHTNMTGADLRLIDNTKNPDSARMTRSELTGQLIFQPPRRPTSCSATRQRRR